MASWRTVMRTVVRTMLGTSLLLGAVAFSAGPAWGLGQDLEKLKGGDSGGGTTARAPEITAGIGAAAALLVGGTVLLGARARRRKQGEQR